MKTILRNKTHIDSRSHDCMIAEIKDKKLKFTYEAYNAVERCTVELFDGYKLNSLFGMYDMGVQPVSNAYVWSEAKRESRANELFKQAEKMCNKLL